MTNQDVAKCGIIREYKRSEAKEEKETKTLTQQWKQERNKEYNQNARIRPRWKSKAQFTKSRVKPQRKRSRNQEVVQRQRREA